MIALLSIFFAICKVSIAGTPIGIESVQWIQSFQNTVKSSGTKPISICSTFGFETQESQNLYDTLFDSKSPTNVSKLSIENRVEDFIIIPCENPLVFADIDGSDISVGYVHFPNNSPDNSKLLAYIQSALESSLRHRHSTKFIFLVLYDNESEIQPSNDQLNQLLEEAWSLSSFGIKSNQHIQDKIQITTLPFAQSDDYEKIKEQLWEKILESTTSNPTNYKSGKIHTGLSYLKTTTIKPTTLPQTSSLKLTSLAQQHFIEAKFLELLEKNLQQFYDANYSPFSVDEVITAVKIVFDEFESRYDTPESSLKLTYQTSLSAQRILSDQLQPLYRKILATALKDAKDTYMTSLKKIPPNSKLHNNISKIGKNTKRDFSTSVASIQKAFLELLRSPWDSLESNHYLSESHTTTNFAASYGTGLESTFLNNYIREQAKERVQFLFLQGAYNPFIRTLKTPPLHLNLNYLFDPRAFSFGREYNKLYDEHTEGVAENRADPIRIPEVAKLVFHPNEHPIPREKRNIWKVLMDFYQTDED